MWKHRNIPIALASLALLACAPQTVPEKTPGENAPPGAEPRTPCQALRARALPFAFAREDRAEAVSAAEVEGFTRRLTRFYDRTGFFRWLLATSHGLDRAAGRLDFAAYWNGVQATRQGKQLLVRHRAEHAPDNLMIPTTDLLAGLAAGSLLTDLPELGALARAYANGLSSTLLGMVWDASDPIQSIMARAVLPETHEIHLPGGRVQTVDFSDWRRPTKAWNTETIHVPNNPFYGDVWVKNTRSKDDLPHVFRAAFYLPFVAACAPGAESRDAAAQGLRLLEGFARDVREAGYRIRTRDASGAIFLPSGDLASLVAYDGLVPDAECAAKLTVALLGSGSPQGLECGSGVSERYEAVAVVGHYYNLAIIRGFHLTALLFALGAGQTDAAQALLEGLAARVDADRARPPEKLPVERDRFERDLAVYLVQASAAGLPLTADEVRLVHRHFDLAMDAMASFPAWDPWDPALPDGEIPWRPEGPFVQPSDLAVFFEYCFSPYRNPGTQPLVDCARLDAPSGWAG